MQNKDEYKAALERAEEELENSVRQKEIIERRILNLAMTIKSLRALCGVKPPSFQEELPGLGLTDAIRRVLEFSDNPLTPTQVRSILTAARFDLSDQSNVMASIHSVLKRLTDAGEILRDQIEEETVYLWLTPLRRALLKEAEDRGKYLRDAFPGVKIPVPPPLGSSPLEPPPLTPVPSAPEFPSPPKAPGIFPPKR
jgi:hypothetical protein